jgi:hypothetical protein
MKMRVQQEPVPVHQIFQQEQSAFARRVGDINVAAAFPQLKKYKALYIKIETNNSHHYQKPLMH